MLRGRRVSDNNNTTKDAKMTKLNENDIRNILLDHFGEGATAKEISQSYGISKSHAKRIIDRKTWKGVSITKEWLESIKN